jgi:chromosome segregation ATPase
VINLAAADANLQVTLANIDVNLKNAEVNLKNAEINLQVAVDNLAEYIRDHAEELAQHDIDLAEDLLEDYEDAAFDLNDLYVDQITLQADLATEQAILAAAHNDFTLAIEAQEAQIAEDSAELIAKEGALADLIEATTASEDDRQEMIDELSVENQNLEFKMDSLRVAEAQENVEYEAALAEETALEDMIDEFEELQDDTTDTNDDIRDELEDIADNDTVIMDNEEWIADADSAIAAEEAEIDQLVDDTVALVVERTEYEEALQPYLDTVQMELDSLPALVQDSIDAEQAEDIAEGNYNANPTQDNLDAWDAATVASDEADAAVADKRQDILDAQATADATGFQDDIDAINEEIYDAGGILEDIEALQLSVEVHIDQKALYNQNIADAEVEIAESEELIDDLTIVLEDQEARLADIFADETAYEDAKDEEISLELATAAALREKAEVTAMIGATQDIFDANDLVIEALQNSQDNLQTVIDNLESDIVDLRESIEDSQAAIRTQDELIADKEAEIADLEAELEQLDVRIAAQEELVARRLELLNDALGL